jgi:hypothetical protein
MRHRALTLLVMLLAAVSACAPFHAVPGDVCNDLTLNYAVEFAYQCNASY